MIPRQNVENLMLRQEVIDAVKRGQFHIYAVQSIDQGLEILTGKKAGTMKADGTYSDGTIHSAVQNRLHGMAESVRRSRRGK